VPPLGIFLGPILESHQSYIGDSPKKHPLGITPPTYHTIFNLVWMKFILLTNELPLPFLPFSQLKDESYGSFQA
jgi:hypothetical protein